MTEKKERKKTEDEELKDITEEREMDDRQMDEGYKERKVKKKDLDIYEKEING